MLRLLPREPNTWTRNRARAETRARIREEPAKSGRDPTMVEKRILRIRESRSSKDRAARFPLGILQSICRDVAPRAHKSSVDHRRHGISSSFRSSRSSRAVFAMNIRSNVSRIAPAERCCLSATEIE